MQNLHQAFLDEAVNHIPSVAEGQAGWECPSNIALVKYWGKKPGQIPANPSISMTLSESKTSIIAEYKVTQNRGLKLEYTFRGKDNPAFAEKINKYLMTLTPFMPFIRNLHIKISSDATFPHSAGIASSASFFGALALVICTIENSLKESPHDDGDFFRKASFIARLGSGSASRSVYGGMVLWGFTPEFQGSSDEYALPFTGDINPEFRHYRDSILIVSTKPKEVSSSTGHKLMEDHPYAACRYKQANNNIVHMLDILNSGDLYGFNEVSENEAMSLHALMMSSYPGFILMKPNTLKILGKIYQYRSATGVPVGFTLDAGANVHLLYPFSFDKAVRIFIQEELEVYCEKNAVIHDHIGKGPVRLY